MDVPRADEIDERRLASRLRAAGLRATQPRLLVLRVLRERGQHLSADEVVAELANRGTPLPRASVYGVIAALSAKGLLMMADIGPGRAVYELADGWHHHFVCRICGVVVDVTCVVGERPCLEPNGVAGEVDEAQIIFRGRCRACLDRAQP